jgi:hypothetical protein
MGIIQIEYPTDYLYSPSIAAVTKITCENLGHVGSPEYSAPVWSHVIEINGILLYLLLIQVIDFWDARQCSLVGTTMQGMTSLHTLTPYRRVLEKLVPQLVKTFPTLHGF